MQASNDLDFASVTAEGVALSANPAEEKEQRDSLKPSHPLAVVFFANSGLGSQIKRAVLRLAAVLACVVTASLLLRSAAQGTAGDESLVEAIVVAVGLFLSAHALPLQLRGPADATIPAF